MSIKPNIDCMTERPSISTALTQDGHASAVSDLNKPYRKYLLPGVSILLFIFSLSPVPRFIFLNL